VEISQSKHKISNLMNSAWAFNALCFAIEKGLLVKLNEPRTAADLSRQCGVPQYLVERVLQVLVSAELIKVESDNYVADKDIRPYITAPVKDYYLPYVISNYFGGKYLMDLTRKTEIAVAWDFTDPEILQSIGLAGVLMLDFFVKEKLAGLGDLALRLRSPTARFLDIGLGVGINSITLCRIFPNLRVAGLEPQSAPLALAQGNIAAAGYSDRIQLRRQRVEDMTDSESFDLAYLAQSFMAGEIVKQGVRNTWKALKPGGWILLFGLSVEGPQLSAAVSRLSDTLYGGAAYAPAQIEEILTQAGFTGVASYPYPGNETYNLVVGQRAA
jgi:precorrin-6B methylase 2